MSKQDLFWYIIGFASGYVIMYELFYVPLYRHYKELLAKSTNKRKGEYEL